MRYHFSFPFVLTLMLVLAACGGQTSPEDGTGSSADVDGIWNGQVEETGTPIVLELVQSGTDVRGSVSVDVLPIPVPVTGTVSGTRLLLSADIPATTVAIDANVVSDTMAGTISIDAAVGTSVTSTFSATRQ